MPAHLLLIDASGFAYRAFHGGLRFPRFRDDGMPTGAVVGFLEIIHRLLGAAGADPVSHAACIFDAPGKTFRHKIFPDYKANRSERDPELSLQLPVMRSAALALGLPALEMEGFEADDLIATLARLGNEAGLRVTIVSSDKDMGQLVRDHYVEIVDPFANKRVLEKDVATKFGVPPVQVVDVQALAGDAVDNILGVDGIGSDTAARLIRKLGSLEAVMAEAAKKTGYRMTASAKIAIHKARKDLPIWRRLATLDRNVPLAVTMDDLLARPIEKRHLEELLRALGAKERFAQIGAPRRAALPETVPRLAGDPLEWHSKAVIEYQKKMRSSTYRITLPVPDAPQCGWYKRRLIKGGPWVPGRIWRERAIDFTTERPGDEDSLHCEVGGAPKNPLDQWNWLLNNPITYDEYADMMRYRDWVKRYGEAGEPEKDEAKPVDWNSVPI